MHSHWGNNQGCIFRNPRITNILPIKTLSGRVYRGVGLVLGSDQHHKYLPIKNISIAPVDIPAVLSPTTDHSSPLIFSSKASLLCCSTMKRNSVTLLSSQVSDPLSKSVSKSSKTSVFCAQTRRHHQSNL